MSPGVVELFGCYPIDVSPLRISQTAHHDGAASLQLLSTLPALKTIIGGIHKPPAEAYVTTVVF